MGFAASGGNATRQLAAVRGVGPRRVSSWRRRRRRDPRGLAPPRGTGVRRGAARPSAPRANQPDRPSLPMTRRQAALATMGLRVCHGRSQQRHALRRSAGRRVAPRAPRSRPPHSHRDRRRDADKSARGQPRHAATSPTARSISAHFHWRKSVPHPVTEYLYSFKVGVRELGFRERSTLNDFERLVAPADYKLINISEELRGRFTEFAREVCEQRLRQVLVGSSAAPRLESLLPELSAEGEAEELGVQAAARRTQAALRDRTDLGTEAERWLGQAHPLEVFVLGCRAEAENLLIEEKLQQALDHPGKWNEHYSNFKHAYLFEIRKGKSGIRKYFAGWRVYCLMSGRNIRYLLELVDHALNRHIEEGHGPESPVDAGVQTRVAQFIGQRNLQQLEGLSVAWGSTYEIAVGAGTGVSGHGGGSGRPYT